MNDKREVSIRVPVLARVEGEGALEIDIRDGGIAGLKLRIFEPPRFFEKFLEGRAYHEVPDMVARICGICPVAYQMSAVHALEGIFGVDPGPWVRAMRRVMYCGEWIESHCLHIHLLAAPDFLGYGSVIEMAHDYPDEVRRGLALQALGNDLIRMLGARSVHPVGVRVGGFHKAPDRETVAALRERLRAALPDAEALLAWTARLPMRGGDQQFPCVALRHASEYPMNEGRIVSDRGLDIGSGEYDSFFAERQVPHSTALHCLLAGQPYLVGPLARINLNADRLPAEVANALHATGISFPSHNPYHSVVARAAEVCYALWEALRILDAYAEPEQPCVPVEPRAGVGFGCTEAPRGLLWHRYETNGDGSIMSARIVPPTSQNQARIEQDLRLSLEAFGLARADDELRRLGEQVIRNYDPCISCSTHFLKLDVRRA
ncbi:MAG TPA: Ni/Fe hydrogenase subunit alpha [Noviherbaspirillum sp.]|nr:Ni/Fe hydrogenase subunit alpha [Noviherbaspirillum sp.]